MSEEKEVLKSIYELHVGDEVVEIKTEKDAIRRFRTAVSKDGSNNTAYLYRNDYDSKGKLIEKYMVS